MASTRPFQLRAAIAQVGGKNAFIPGAVHFVAQTFVCATDSTERALETLWIKMAAGGTDVIL
ncbi:MAG: hypothetical protein L0H37_01690, partial [Nitrosospira sp.]|nr:hypothetical protein [Nitrosospira sp.]